MNIIIGVCGGIAAYKSAELVRGLRQAGHDVRVVMTKGAQAFITALTLQNLSGHPVLSQLLNEDTEALFSHIELARWADLILIAPATAHFIAKIAQGFADDLLSTLCLASTAKIALAPAMNHVMWQAAATQANIATLKQRDSLIWGPEMGLQACGESGMGRMCEPAALCEKVAQQQYQPLVGLQLLITAGATREDIDPVRFISNRSSGKMGYALATAARDMGAEVTLISAPVCLQVPERVRCVYIYSAADMYQACMEEAPKHQIFISCAAVADYRPVHVAEQKIKKNNDIMQLELQKNPDILRNVSALAAEQRPFCVGFAAETEQLQHHAQAKLKAKNLDMIAANAVNHSDIGFDSNDNALSVYWQDGTEKLNKAPKLEIARRLLKLVWQRYQATSLAADN